MRINQLRLTNIGAYRGKYQIDLTTDAQTNIILIGGKNGAGKTTLLESIRVALFGSLAYGYASNNQTYLNTINNLLNNEAKSKKDETFEVSVNITQVENFEKSKYTLIRSWSIKNSTISEVFEVRRDGIFLSDSETSNFQNKIREDFPPQLMDLCMFDGEEISKIISDNKLFEYIKNSAKVLFNLDLFESLEQDITNFIIDETKKTKEHSEINTQFREIKQKINELNEEREKVVEKLKVYNTKLHGEEIFIQKSKEDFEIHGGLAKENRQKLITQLNEIEHRRKMNSEKLKDFVSSIFPFYLVRELLDETVKQMENEQVHDVFDFINKNINPEHMSQVMQNMSALKNSNTASERQILYESFLNLLKPDENQSIVHRASFAQRSYVQEIFNLVTKNNSADYIKLMDENDDLLKKATKIRKRIEINDSSSEFEELLQDIENATVNAQNLKVLIQQLEEELVIINDELYELNLASDKLFDQINSIEKSGSFLSLSSNILKVSKKFRELQLIKNLKAVEKEAVKMAKKLFRKDFFISRIHIDHQTFQTSLFDVNQNLITKERLSAGEKELLILCVTWAMFKCSGRRLPLVFDTLFGRLDVSHKMRLIEHYLPHCSEQVIILSTDSEISDAEFNTLNGHLSKYYTLEFNTQKNAVDILPNTYLDVKEVVSI